jgi:hypothetical protein
MNFKYNTKNIFKTKNPSITMSSSNEIKSICIPRLSNLYTENDVKYTFKLLSIGQVNRVDFVPIHNHKNNNKINENFQSAFVHFDFFYDTSIAQDTQNYLYNSIAFKLHLDDSTFWWILNNKNPIPETKLNIHQLAENMRLLEEKVKQQEETILRLQEIIDENNNFDNIEAEASAIAGQHIYFNDNSETTTEEDNDEDDELSIASTHSSMPGLTPINAFNDFMINYHYNDDNDNDDKSIYSNSSMPELISDSGSSKNRVNFTKEYCDNY